jgi:signal transduction histidine kinase
MIHQRRVHTKERRRDKRIREEFEAYARLDVSLHGTDSREAAKAVCRVVAKKSAFQRVALLTKSFDGRLCVAGSIGMDEMTILAIYAWGERVMNQEPDSEIQEDFDGIRIGERSHGIVLGKDAAEAGCGRAIVIPLRTSTDEMAGLLVVCADSMMSVQRRRIEEMISPLETLALKLSRAMDDTAQAEWLLRVQEQKTGQGLLLARGMAQTLNHSLTAVVGFAELIAETAGMSRVRSDADKIIQEAQRMRQTVQNLLTFGRAAAQAEEPVEIAALVREMTSGCKEKLNSRGIRLVVEVEDGVPPVRGNGERLRLVLEHLLDNAAHAIASVGNEVKREHEIRIAVSHDPRSVQVIVSHTGPCFKDPARVFDPSHMPPPSSDGAKAGLSVCCEIVQEHRGEISAFNLHPYGAAVVVELPLGKAMGHELPGVVREVA